MRRPPRSTRTDTLFPYTTLFRSPTRDQALAAQRVYGLLSDSRYHYKPRPLDDALSSQIFDDYLKALDNQKLFFTQADIDAFAAYRTPLDDAIRNGELQPAFDISNVYSSEERRVGKECVRTSK